MITYNPIAKKDDLSKNIIFQALPIARPGTTIVLSKETMNISNSLTCVGTNGPTSSEIRWGGYKAYYTIDISSHTIEFDCELCSTNSLFKFLLNVKMTCSVIDPKIIIEKNITDVTAFLQPIFESEIQEISRSYEIENWQELRNRIHDLIKIISKNTEYFKLGDIYSELNINKEAKLHLEEMYRIEKEKELELQRLRQNKQIEAERQRIELEELKSSEQVNLEKLRQMHKLEEEKLNNEINQLRQFSELNMEKLKQEQLFEKEKAALDTMKFENLVKMIDGNDMNLLLIDMIKGTNQGKQTLLDKNSINEKNRAEVLQYINYALKEKILEPHSITPFALNLLKSVAGNLNGFQNNSNTNESPISLVKSELDNESNFLEILSSYEDDTKE